MRIRRIPFLHQQLTTLTHRLRPVNTLVPLVIEVPLFNQVINAILVRIKVPETSPG